MRNWMKLRTFVARVAMSWIVTSVISIAGAFPACAGAPAGEDGASPNNATRVILLGTNGGPVLTRTRSEPANLLVVGGKAYLIDAGEGVARQMLFAGFQAAELSAVFITHHHLDHDAGLVPLMSLLWAGRAFGQQHLPAVQIYGPPSTKFLAHLGLEYLSVSERIFRAGLPELSPATPMFAANDIDKNGVVYRDKNVRVTAIENTHFGSHSGSPETGEDKSYSYRFDTAYGSVVFTGDTGPSPAVIQLARGADLLVSEICLPPSEWLTRVAPVTASPAHVKFAKDAASHMIHEHLSPAEVGKMAEEAHVKAVLLTHFVPGMGGDDVSKFVNGTKSYYSGPVIAGHDLLEYDLDTPPTAK